MPPIILKSDKLNPKEWNNFVLNSNNGSVFNTMEWLSLWNNNENTTAFCLINGKEDIVSAIPFIEIRNFGFKNYYSMPYAGYGGVLLKTQNLKLKTQSSELIREFNKLAKGNWGMLAISDFNNDLKDCRLETLGFKKIELATHLLNLACGISAIQQSFIPAKRRIIKSTEKYALETCKVTSEKEVKECYKMMKETAKKHNKKSPEFPIKFYLRLFHTMKDYLLWLVVKKDSQYLATIINLAYKDSIIYWDMGSYSAGLNYRPNDMLIWETIKWGIENKYKYFNFGGSPSAGLTRFKESWGGNKKSYSFYYRHSPLFKGIKYLGNTLRGL